MLAEGAFTSVLAQTATQAASHPASQEAARNRDIGILLGLMGALAMVFGLVWLMACLKRRDTAAEPGTEVGTPNPIQLGIGFVTDFLDTLGIGSFATTTALFRSLRQVPDRIIPGTLNIGHALPTVLQAFIYIKAIEVETSTLIWMIAAATVGAWVGAGFVADLPKRKVQLGMGIALLIAGAVLTVRTVSDPTPHVAKELSGAAFSIGVAVNFVLGVLMMIGVGLYAPCLVLVQLLGMSTDAAFPIMMGSCAFLMPVAGIQFIRKNSFSPRAALGLTIAGLPAVWLAATLVKSLSLKVLNWFVLAVILYTAITMILAARRPASSTT